MPLTAFDPPREASPPAPPRPQGLPIAAAGIAAAAANTTMLGLPAVLPYLMEGFHLTHGQGGLLISALWIPHAVAQAFSGWGAAALGVQRLLRWTLLGMAAVVAASLAAPSYRALLGLRMLVGVGTGAVFLLGTLYAAAHSDPALHRRHQAVVGSIGYLSSTAAYVIIPWGLAAAGWRAGYFPALLCTLAALVLACLGPGVPARPEPERAALALRVAVGVVWRGRIPVLALAHLCSFGFFMVVGSWLTAYFVEQHGLDPVASLLVSAGVLAAGAVGRFAGGAALGRIADRRLVMTALAVSGVGLGLLALSPPFPLTPVLAFAVLLCCTMTYGSIFAMAFGRRPPNEAGVAIAGVSLVAGVGAAILPALMGWMVDATGSFGPGFALLAGLSGLTTILLGILPPRG